MKSLRIVASRHGGPEVLEPQSEAAPEPSPGEVRIRILVAGVSFADLLMQQGLHPEPSPVPFTPGWDIVGTIDKCGDRVKDFQVGETVAALPIHGGYAQHICLTPDKLTRVPDGVDPAEAVSIMLNYITAYQMLHRAVHVAAGQRILVHGAAGGVGSALLQLGRVGGLEMYGTASPANFALVSELGATPVDYRSTDFVEEIRRLTGDGVDFVFDGVGEDHVWRSFRPLRPGGRVVAYGFTAFLDKGHLAGGMRYRFRGFIRPLWYALKAMLSPGKRRILPYSIQFLMRRRPDRFREDLGVLLTLLKDGTIKPLVAERFPLAQARQAQERLARGSVRGKIVLICNEPKPSLA